LLCHRIFYGNENAASGAHELLQLRILQGRIMGPGRDPRDAYEFVVDFT
jgi:hypothetical protein